MRYLAILLSMFVLMLSIQPSIAGIESMLSQDVASCCSSDASDAHDCCDTGNCNTMMSCGCCFMAWFVAGEMDGPIATLNIPELISTNVEGNYSSYIADCFHPPELV